VSPTTAPETLDELRGILGPHAQFDPAALDTPKLDDAETTDRRMRERLRSYVE